MASEPLQALPVASLQPCENPTMLTRDACTALDTQDPLAGLRAQFDLPAGRIYLDGNSLGALPSATSRRLQQVVAQEWGQGLIESWNTAGWMSWPQRVGDKIARLIGAAPGEVVAADSTSVNLYKVLRAATSIQHRAQPTKRVLLSQRDNFPTDLYIAQSVCAAAGWRLEPVEAATIPARLAAGDVAVLMLTHVNYRTGAMHDMATLTALAHAAGALTVWDLAHSAGSVPVRLHAADADFAVGCGYKFLNGGPGAPAFVWAHPRHVDAAQPLSGWIGHARPFQFIAQYEAAAGIHHYLCGSPPILGLAALDCGVDSVLAAEPLGGMDALHAKAGQLGDLFIRLVDERCAGFGLELASPRDAAQRGSQVSLAHAQAWPVMQALIARSVIGDFRAGLGGDPDLLRFGFTPLYLRFADIWDAVQALAEILGSRSWDAPAFHARKAVT